MNARRTRGWVTLYALAFAGLLLASGALVFAFVGGEGFLSSEAPLWLCVALSAVTIVLAILAASLPRSER